MEARVKTYDPSRSTKIAGFLVNLMLVLLLVGGAVTIVSTAVGLARDGNTLLGGRTLPVHAELPREQVGSLPRGVVLTHDLPVTLEVKDPSARQLLLSTGTAVGPFVLLAGALWLLRGLARSVRQGDPFGPANVQRLRRLGFLLVVGAPVVESVNWALRLSLANTLPPNALGSIGFPGFSFPFVLLLAGLGAFILAEVFAYGLRLREDVEGTV
jgi:Protein of unknown function (DUF2975)